MTDQKQNNVFGILQIVTMLVGIATLLFAFRAAALTDPNVADFQQLAQAAQEVISNDSMTVAGMNYLVSVNLLTEQRKNKILGLT